MRRRPPSVGSVPANLAVFNHADWPADRGYKHWTTARAAWVAAGNAWPGGELARLGDELTQASRVPDSPWPGI